MYSGLNSGDRQVFSSSRMSQLRFVQVDCLDPEYPPVPLTGVGCTYAYGVCFFNWCRLYLCLLSLFFLLMWLYSRLWNLFFQLVWAVPVPIESAGFAWKTCSHWDWWGGWGWQSGSWEDRIQWVVVEMVQPVGEYLNCWPNDGDFTRLVEFHWSWGPGSAALLVRDGKGRAQDVPWGLGSVSWDS